MTANNVWEGKAMRSATALLSTLQHSKSEKQLTEVVHDLRKYFLEALHAGIVRADTGAENAAARMVGALLDQYNTCQALLLSMLHSKRSPEFHLTCLSTVMDFTRAETVGQFQDKLFRKMVHTMVTSKHVQPEVLRAFASKFCHNWDVRYHTLCEVRNTARMVLKGQKLQAWQAEDPSDACLHMLLETPASAGEPACSWCGGLEHDTVQDAPDPHEGSRARRKRKRLQGDHGTKKSGRKALWANPAAQLAAYSEAWMAFLQIPLPEHVLQQLLPELTTTVARHIKNPLAMSDFFTKAVDQGGLSGILALQGLFFLVTEHGLEHPEFYERLCSLLVPQVFTAKYRSKFLQLTDIFLASSMVPAYTAAAFAKRFARLALSAPPAGALCCMAFAHNLIRRHPGCMCLIHRPNSAPGPDPYNPDAQDLDGSKGIESCLWELEALKAHLDPTVLSNLFSSVADASGMLKRKLSDRKRVAEVDIGSFIHEGYASLLSKELDKQLRRAPDVGTELQSRAALHKLPGFSA